jgi:hypothetical protein
MNGRDPHSALKSEVVKPAASRIRVRAIKKRPPSMGGPSFGRKRQGDVSVKATYLINYDQIMKMGRCAIENRPLSVKSGQYPDPGAIA